MTTDRMRQQLFQRLSDSVTGTRLARYAEGETPNCRRKVRLKWGMSLKPVRDLMLMCVISPLVFLTVRRMPALVLPALALLFVLGIGNGWRGFSNSALLFFSLGGFFAVRRIDLPLWAYMRRGALIPAAFALWVAVVWLADAPSVLALLTGGRLNGSRR